jgi:DNA polymerase V
MRRYRVAAANIFVLMHSNTFNNDPFYSNGSSARLSETTSDTGEVVALACAWENGFNSTASATASPTPVAQLLSQPGLFIFLKPSNRMHVKEKIGPEKRRYGA